MRRSVELEELAEALLCDSLWFELGRLGFPVPQLPQLSATSSCLHQGLITWDMEPPNGRGGDNCPPWGLHEYLVIMHSLSRARNDIVWLLNAFILGAPASIIDILESGPSKWLMGRNPEVSMGSEFVHRDCYVIVTNASGLVYFQPCRGCELLLKFYFPTRWCLCCYGGVSLAWVSRSPLKIDRPK